MVDKLQEEIARIPPNQRFFTGNGPRLFNYYGENACVFGYGTYADRFPLEDIPDNTKGLYFYYGAGIKGLLQEILKLPIISNLEHLAIGITHSHAKDYADYSEISKLLAHAHFPKLKFFEYGIDELIANEHCIYGNLFDITNVLSNMPRLEKLSLYGNFELTRSFTFSDLTDLNVLMDDWATNINGGKISNITLQHLLSSKFEALQSMSIDVDFNDDLHDYSLPDIFLSGQAASKLEYLELGGKFKAGTKSQIENSGFLRNQVKVDISSLEEPTV